MFYEPDKNDHGLPHDPFKSIVVPRPIGWISSLDREGRLNLAPFSQFNNLGYDPPYVMFAAANFPRSPRPKDSVTNVIETGEFVVNMATYALREAVNITGSAVEPETDEAKLFSRASPGGKLNLSADELGLFSKSKSSPDEVNAVLRTLLKARYEAYRKDGLKGIAPYTRGKKTISPTDALQQAITQTMTAARQQDYFQALLQYPAKEIPGMEHRFFWFKQTVEDRPTFILAHRTKVRVEEKAALLTEEQFYVSHSYNANFIAGACLAVEGGTMVFYVNRTFTDQVAGFGSGLKHSIGRGQMLSQVEEQLRGVREKLK